MKFSPFRISRKTEEPFENMYAITIDGTSGNFTFTGAEGEYNVYIFDGNEIVKTYNGLIDEETITFEVNAEYNLFVEPTGVNPFNKIRFNNGGDRLKLLKTLQWGNYGVNEPDQSEAFRGCNNHDEIAGDGKWFDVVTNGSFMFQNNNNLTSLPSDMTLPNLTSGRFMFQNNSLSSLPSGMTLQNLVDGGFMFDGNDLISLPSGMTLPNLENGRSMFRNNFLTSLPSGMTLPNLTDGRFMFLGNIINTTRYSQLLIDMEANNPNNNVVFHGGSSKYNAAGEVAKNALIARGWSINDGGLE